MSQLSFLRGSEPLPLATLAVECGAHLPRDADPSIVIRSLASLQQAHRDELAAYRDDMAPDDLRETWAGACLVAPRHLEFVPSTTVALVTEAPWRAFLRLAAMLHPGSLKPVTAVGGRGIDPSVRIYEGTLLERGVSIDPGAVLGPGVEVGAGTFIGAQVVIGSGVRIGRDCAIDAHVSLAHALVGDRVVIHAGARIGQGSRTLRLGRVIIQNDVEIGANAAVDRGFLADTVLGEGSSIAALAHVPPDHVTPRLSRYTGLSPEA